MLRFTTRGAQGDTVTVSLSGALAGDAPTHELRRFLEEQYVTDGVTLIAIDASELNEIDLEGVATLLALRRESDRRGKRFVVRDAVGQVREKLEQTGVLGFLRGTEHRSQPG